MKLFVDKISNGNKQTFEYPDNEQGAKVKFHQLCATLWNSGDVLTGTVEIQDENLNTYKGFKEEIDKRIEPVQEGDEPVIEDYGKLYVLNVVNGNLMVDQISEWNNNTEGQKGARVAFHNKCATYWNTPDVYDAIVRIANSTLDPWGEYTENISHPKPEPEPEPEG